MNSHESQYPHAIDGSTVHATAHPISHEQYARPMTGRVLTGEQIMSIVNESPKPEQCYFDNFFED